MRADSVLRPILGGIYLVTDESLSLPPESKRRLHKERRPFVVLSGPETNRNEGWPLVLGCPLSSQTSWRTSYCVQINKGEFGQSKKTWIRVPALQPLEKAMLEDRVGLLDAARLELVQSRVVDYMGMLDEGDDEELTTEEPWA
ncbi:type II toxin-antitoxin system PemK/MazF family toxin [Nesterenkonia alba]|uniref:type II toxin-antitoxin system PemK/MazF family toxin n=1 Tax=Nesterenkonia alba TaxID=515814 RepID=UPI000A04D921|nr:type II toxin-antitoxin system PemK/MazF family toxin [Nesterenkonia alba]